MQFLRFLLTGAGFAISLAFLLRKEGFTAAVAGTGQQALEEFDRNGADIVLLDLMLPGMSGTDVCKALRQRSAVPVIMVTARDSEIDKVVGLELGADDYVTKPCDLTELRARLKVGERMVTLERTMAHQVVTLRDALDQVRQLKELLPICAWCKRVRGDEDYWQSIEEYLHDQAGTDFTHGICPHCVEEMRRKAVS